MLRCVPGLVDDHDWLLATRTLDATVATREAAKSDDPFELEPLPLDAWLADPYYSNHGFDLGPEQLHVMRHIEWVFYPETWERLGWTRDDVRLVHLICLKWGKGSGKDTISQVGLLRIAYLLQCLRSPQSYFGIGTHSVITMLNVALSAPQASSVFFNPLKAMVEANIEAKGFWYGRAAPSGQLVTFDKGLELVSGHSKTGSQEGKNLIAGVADEIAEFLTKEELEKRSRSAAGREPQMSAEALDTMLRTSGRSRFPATFKAMYLSWTRFTGDYIEQLYNEGEKELATEGTTSEWYISHKATWEANPTRTREDFDADYRKNPEDSAAKYECKPPDSRDRFFRNLVSLGLAFPERVWTWSDGDETSGPVRYEYRYGPDPDSPNMTGWQAVYEFHPDWEPITWSPVAVHIDLAWTGDRAGIGICHVSDYVHAEPSGPDDNPIPIPVVDLDLALALPQGPEGEIELRWARQLIFRMVEAGWRIAYVSLDGYQSVDTIQTINAYLGANPAAKGVKEERKKVAETYSLDRTTEGYDTLKSMIYGRTFRGYRLPRTINGKRATPEEIEAEDPRIEECIHWRELKALERLGGLSSHAKVDHPPYGCFTADTRVPLLDGTFPTIAELDGRQVWVYSTTPEGKFRPGLARGRYTKHVSELVDVVLDSGSVVRCTPEHRWQLRDGTYKAASELRPGIDRLMALNQTWPVNGGYERLTDRDGYREMTHRQVSAHVHGPIPEGWLVHHANEDKTDNRPENLEQVPPGDHAANHTAERWANDPDYRAAVAEGLRSFNESPEARAKHAAALRRTNEAKTPADLRRAAEARAAFRHDITLAQLDAIRDDPEATTANAAARILGCGRNVVVRVLRDHGHATWAEFLVAPAGVNHKVRAVIPVTLAEPVPVYDLEVDEWANFLLAAGVVVHNSKDVADGIAGAARGALRAARIWGVGSPDATTDVWSGGAGEFTEVPGALALGGGSDYMGLG